MSSVLDRLDEVLSSYESGKEFVSRYFRIRKSGGGFVTFDDCVLFRDMEGVLDIDGPCFMTLESLAAGVESLGSVSLEVVAYYKDAQMQPSEHMFPV